MMLPFKAMVTCLALLPPTKILVCEDVTHAYYLCINKQRCATLQSLSIVWKRHPEKYEHLMRKINGASP